MHTRESDRKSCLLAVMNTRFSSDTNGNSTGNLEEQSSNCNIEIPPHKSYSSRDVNSLIKNVLEQLTGLEEAMMDNDDEDSNVNVDLSRIESEDDEQLEEDEEEEDDAAIAGFRFCAEETIRFLIQEEHFSPDDPIILELQQHLEQQQRNLQERLKKQTTEDNASGGGKEDEITEHSDVE